MSRKAKKNTTVKSPVTSTLKKEEKPTMTKAIVKTTDKPVAKVTVKAEVKSNVTPTIKVPKVNTADAWKEAAVDLATQIGKHWTCEEIRAQIESNWKELGVLPDKRIDEVKSYIRKDSVGRAWLSRKKLFGPSGYKVGKHPKKGTGDATPKVVLSDEEKASRKKDAVERSWISRKKAHGESGYKAGHSPLNKKAATETK